MNKSSLPASISALALLCGCTVSASQQNFGTAATTAAAAGGATASFTAQVYSEQRFTSLSHDFLSHRPTGPVVAKSCPTTAEKEVKKSQDRKEAYDKIVVAYVETLNGYLSDNINYLKYAEELNGALDQAKSIPLGAQYSGLIEVIKPFVTVFSKALNQYQLVEDMKRITKHAEGAHPKLIVVVEDLKRRLLSSNEQINAEIVTWEECERNRLRLIYSDPAVTAAEMNTLFEAFFLKLETLKGKRGVFAAERKSLDDLLKAHEKLARAKLNWSDFQAVAKEAAALAKEFKAALDAAQKAL